MKAITVKFTAGDVKHLFTASDNDESTPKRVRWERDNSLQFEDNYDAAARKLCFVMGWFGTLIKSTMGKGQRVYVWANDVHLEVEQTRTRHPQETEMNK